MSGIQRHWNHSQPCDHCGEAMCNHKRERVYDGNGPPGSYNYEYTDCPTGRRSYK